MITEIQTTKPSKFIIGILFILLLLFGTSLMGTAPVLHLLGQSAINTTLFIITRLAYWLCLAIIWLYAVKIEKQPLLLWEEKNYAITKYLLFFIAIAGSVIIGNGLIDGVLHVLHISGESKAMDKMMVLFRAHKSLLLLTAFTAGVTEELIFRGYIQPRLELLFKNTWSAIFISSLLFGLLHYRYGTWFNVLGPFMMGLVFAFYYSKYRNIKLLILFHFLWDVMAISLTLFVHHQ